MFNYFIEVKNRLIYILITFLIIALISFFYKESLLYFIVKSSVFKINNELPFFIYTNLTEVFITYIKLSVLTGIYLTVPFFIVQVWLFISPGLYLMEYKKFKRVLFVFIIVWFVDSLFIYNYLLPWLWDFFLGFDNSILESPLNLHFEAKLNEYLDFIVSTFILCGLTSQVLICSTVILLSLNQYNIFFICGFRRYVYILTFIFSALITPPDIISQLLVAFPIITIYEVFIIFLLVKNDVLFIIFNKY